ncbi:MAG: family 10 glycosylhydrolase, partial [Muribaculaceae bacterium]|nr:family 10 glycosylhydrolase [Muribaculaceae bacterium]
LIKELNNTIKGIKPWVRFGISPFGVWRNNTSDPNGSETQALENYDSLYADVILWTKEGWVDYMLPQLYWELEHPKASCEKLAYWWDKNANGRHMYYGQAVEKTMDKPDIAPGKSPTQLDHKIALTRELENVQGNCWWPGYSVTKNYKGIADSLATNRQSTVALVPAYTWIDSIAPEGVSNLKLKEGKLTWRKAHTSDVMQMQRAFVVYAFPKGEKVDIENSEAILGVTYTNAFNLSPEMKGKYTIAVTALDAANNESEEVATIEVKL